MRLYCIFDNVASVSSPVFEAKNDGVARRMYRASIKQNPDQVPSEFDLWYLGDFDNEGPYIQACAADAIVLPKEE